jgi:hypothetical protein
MLSGEIPDTGSLRGDVAALLTRLSTRLAKTGPEMLYGLLGDYLSDAELFDRLRTDVFHIDSLSIRRVGRSRSPLPGQG